MAWTDAARAASAAVRRAHAKGKVQRTVLLYHGTNKAAAAKILRQGIHPAKSLFTPKGRTTVREERRVFLTRSMLQAKFFASAASRKSAVVLNVDVPLSRLKTFSRDWTGGYSRRRGIPASWISVNSRYARRVR